MLDCHLHSENSHDSTASMLSMIEAVCSENIQGLTFTEHFDVGFPNHVPGGIPDTNLYYKRYLEALTKAPANFKILLGCEMNWEYGYKKERDYYVGILPFDYVICSVHSLNDMNIFYKEAYEGYEKNDFCRLYLKKVYDSISSGDDFDSVGHIGFIAKNAPYDDPVLHYSDLTDISDEILKRIIQDGHALEINTSGYRRMGIPIPEYPFFKRYKELGGELVTIGSDGHSPEVAALKFHEAAKELKDLGFDYLTHYENRIPVFDRI